jgi:curved DNA-binding protein CbpA
MRLYGWAAATDATALLELTLNDRTIVVHFKRGAPEFIDSTHAHDALPAFLMAQGLATPAQLEEAEAQKARFGGELLPALFGLGLVNPNIVFQQIAERSTAILFRALTAESGTFTCQARELPAHKALPLGNRWSLYLEQLRRTPAAEVRRRMASFLSLPVMRSGGAVPATDLKLQPQEARALQFFDGVRSLQELVGAHPMEADVLMRAAWMLKELDLVSFEGTPVPVEAGAEAPVMAAPSAVVPAASVAAASSATESPPPVAPVPMPVAPPKVSAPSVARPGPPPPSAAPSTRPTAAPAGSRPLVATMGPPGAVPGNPASMPPRQAVAYPERKPTGSVPASTGSGARAPTITAQVVSSSSGIRGAPTAAPAKGPAPAAGAGGAAASNDVGQLTQVLEKLRKQTYFEVLNIPREGDANAAKMAYFRLAKLCHPDTVPQGSPESLARVKADLFALIGEAHRTLSDPKLKQDYIAELDSGTQGEKVDVARLLLAEELFQRGRALVKARKWAEAVKALDEAIAANAQEGEYFGWRGFARFFLHEDKAKGHAAATRDIEYGLKLNPNAAATHYFQGYLWKMMGDLGRAKTHFKRCVELDPRHIDAQRELRIMK